MSALMLTGALALLLAGLEIKEVKNLGVSAANNANSIVQVTWQTDPAPENIPQSFEVELGVTYADNFTQIQREVAGGRERRQRFEVPTQHLVPNQPAAKLKRYRVTITARRADAPSETVTAQGIF